MRATAVVCLAASALAWSPQAVLRVNRRRAALTVRHSTDEDAGSDAVDYLSNVVDTTNTTKVYQVTDLGSKTAEWDEQVAESGPTDNAGPTSYGGFKNSDDGFDGGDGQVGVVGDGSNAMEVYDMNEVVGSDESSVNAAVAAFNARAVGSTDDTFAVSDPKNVAGGVGGSDSKQAKSAVAFGFTTGYADKLKKDGMVDIDKDGVDRLATRRQQLENWTNQRNLRDTQISANEQLAFMEGLDDEPARVMTSAGYFDQMTAGMEQTKMDKFKDMAPDDGSPPPKWFSATAGAKDDMEVVLANGVADLLEVFNDAIGYEDFSAAFTPDSDKGFAVRPTRGTMPRASAKEATDFQVVFKTDNKSGEASEGRLIVQTEETKWTIRVVGTIGS